MNQPIEQYTVRGHWPFPLDMLRRDQSVGASEADIALIARLSGDHVVDGDDLETAHEITLRMVEGPSRSRPNAMRWRSFGWDVVAPADPLQSLLERESRMAALRASALAKLSKEEIEALEWHGLHAKH